MTQGNTFSGSGSFSGAGSVLIVPQFTYSVDLSVFIPGDVWSDPPITGYNIGSFWISEINLGTSGTHPYIAANWPASTEKLITVSGLSGANSSMNGQQFTASPGDFGYSDLYMGVDGSLYDFIAAFSLQNQSLSNYPGFTINWN